MDKILKNYRRGGIFLNSHDGRTPSLLSGLRLKSSSFCDNLFDQKYRRLTLIENRNNVGYFEIYLGLLVCYRLDFLFQKI